MSHLRPHPVACPRNNLRRKPLDPSCTMSPIEIVFDLPIGPFPIHNITYPCLLIFFGWDFTSISVPSLPHFLCCKFIETLFVATTCSCYFLCQAWQTGACFLAFVQHACCHEGASRWNGGQLYLSLPSLRSLHCWCDRVFQPPHCQCSHLGPLALLCTADTLLIAFCPFWS